MQQLVIPKKAEDVMKIVQGWSEKEVPNKKEVLGSLHSCIGNALFDLGDTDKALEYHQRDFELAKQWWEFEEMILCHIKSDVRVVLTEVNTRWRRFPL